jgi:hypothetical protein
LQRRGRSLELRVLRHRSRSAFLRLHRNGSYHASAAGRHAQAGAHTG